MVFNELQGCSQCEFWNTLAFCLWTWRCRGFCCVARPPSRRSGDAWCFDLVKVFTVAVFFSCCEGRAGNLCKRRVIDNGDICGGWEVHFFGSGIRNGLHGALHLRHRRLSVSNGAANPMDERHINRFLCQRYPHRGVGLVQRIELRKPGNVDCSPYLLWQHNNLLVHCYWVLQDVSRRPCLLCVAERSHHQKRWEGSCELDGHMPSNYWSIAWAPRSAIREELISEMYV